MEPLAREQHAGFRQFLIEFAHLGKHLFARHHPCFRFLARLYQNHKAHFRASFLYQTRTVQGYQPGFYLLDERQVAKWTSRREQIKTLDNARVLPEAMANSRNLRPK